MRHWHLQHRQKARTHFVMTQDGNRPSDEGVDESRFAKVTELDRAPEEHDDFIGGALVENAERKARAARHVKLHVMDRVDFAAYIENRIREIMQEKPNG